MTFRKFSKRATITSLLLGTLFAGSVAFAAWTATGTGDGSAAAVSAASITVTATTATADLYPGKNDGSLYVKLVNPNPYPVQLTNLTRNTVSTDLGHAGCNVASVGLVGVIPAPINLAANNGSAGGPDEFAGPIPNVVTMSTAAVDACQGAPFTINLTISGLST